MWEIIRSELIMAAMAEIPQGASSRTSSISISRFIRIPSPSFENATTPHLTPHHVRMGWTSPFLDLVVENAVNQQL
jgi:hypothetical protein